MNIDYRDFDANDIEPLFEFGFGLSYTTFEYFGLKSSFSNDFAPTAENWMAGLATSGARNRGSAVEEWYGPSTSPYTIGFLTSMFRLHRQLWTVTFKLQNAGTVAGTEIPQLYITFPESAKSPPRVLRGFENVMLKAGETTTIEFGLSRYDLSVWSVEQQAWVAPGHDTMDSTYTLHVGASSRDFRLKGSLSLA